MLFQQNHLSLQTLRLSNKISKLSDKSYRTNSSKSILNPHQNRFKVKNAKYGTSKKVQKSLKLRCIELSNFGLITQDVLLDSEKREDLKHG